MTSEVEIKCTNKYCSKSGRCWRFNAPDSGKNQLSDFYEPYIVTDKHETTQCAWYMTPTKKRGGPQPGSGRPPKDPKDKVVKCRISMTQAHHAATEGDRAGMIRRALDAYLPTPKKDVILELSNGVAILSENGGECAPVAITGGGGDSTGFYASAKPENGPEFGFRIKDPAVYDHILGAFLSKWAEKVYFVNQPTGDKPKSPDTTTVTITTNSEVSEPIVFTVKGYED